MANLICAGSTNLLQDLFIIVSVPGGTGAPNKQTPAIIKIQHECIDVLLPCGQYYQLGSTQLCLLNTKGITTLA